MNNTLHQVILHILRPLVRILHRYGVAFGEFSQLARKVYVEAAEQALLKTGEKATTSRIAITTGLTRKEVAQLRAAPEETLIQSTRYNRGVRVIDGWQHDPAFVDARGKPLKLVLQGPLPSFEQLVARYSGDMPYRAMLKELVQNKLAVELADGKVELLADAYIPLADEEEVLNILGSDVRLLMHSIEHNLDAPVEQRYFQRKVSYDNLPIEAVETFRRMARADSMALLVKFNEWLAIHDRDNRPLAQGSGRMRAGVGIYYFEEAVTPHADDKDTNNAD